MESTLSTQAPDSDVEITDVPQKLNPVQRADIQLADTVRTPTLRQLGEPSIRRSGTDVSLLQEPGIEGWDDWTVPTSMRNVEDAVPLALRINGIPQSADAWEAPERSAPVPAPQDTGA